MRGKYFPLSTFRRLIAHTRLTFFYDQGDASVSPVDFRAIMTRLLGFIDKDKQTESLADKFTNRFTEAALAATPKPARDVSFCLSVLTLSDRGFKKFMDAW
jgi:condensin complex subunit 1